MKHYYLINGKIMSANEKMPDNGFDYTNWFYSLQPCEISESELDKVKDTIHIVDLVASNPIEVTEIVEEIQIDKTVG